MPSISIRVADLLKKPSTLLPQTFAHNDLRDSQLLFNEEIEILEKQGEWVKIQAVEQFGYEGWIHQSQFAEKTIKPQYVVHTFDTPYSYGTYLEEPIAGSRPIPRKLDREQLIEEAKLFLGAPYLWGGRSSPLKNTIASVDCSGLINLLYRAQGVLIPRDAHDQYLFWKKRDVLEPGNPLYLAKNQRINHVILKLSDELFIESPETGKNVRLLKWGKDIWEKNELIYYLDRSDCYHPHVVH